MKKLIIIGANYLQKPLVQKAAEMGLETHVFAWEDGAVAKEIADYFYPISILEKEQILAKAREIRPDGIVSIGSDIAMHTVNFISEKLNLVGNTLRCTEISTNKYKMRIALSNAGVSCPKFCSVKGDEKYNIQDFIYPLIVKPTDRSGSRGVTKIENSKPLETAIKKAQQESLSNEAIIEEFFYGKEYSVEMISFQGDHHYITVTEKVTTEAPYFVETEHHQPAPINIVIERKIINEVKNGLDALEIKNGASHSEVRVNDNGDVKIVEIAGRMGGELIGSDMVYYSTGYDFVKGVIEIALGEFNGVEKLISRFSGVYYVIPNPGKIINITDNSGKFPEIVKTEIIYNIGEEIDYIIDGAGKRPAVFVYFSEKSKFQVNPNEIVVFEVHNEDTI